MIHKKGLDSYGENIKYTQDDLAVKFLPAVRALAFKLKEKLPSSIETSDLISIGTEEMVKLARKYDEAQNDSFWGYARKRVYGAMLDYLRSLDTVSRSDRKLIKDVDKIVSRQFGEHGEEPTDEEISKELGVEIDKVREARSSIGVFNVMPLGEQLQIYKDSDTLEGLEDEELIKRVRGILDGFTQREQTVIQLYYFEELKLDEISEILGITISRISQIHRHVLSKIRETLER
ncbi:MAG TPA: RNA polymerase sigma factor FliA [Campylobacterales bacterium]|nr:RNA polymerase sigma factor FliA [Campylobacterales bacterium]